MGFHNSLLFVESMQRDMCMGVVYSEWQCGVNFQATVVDIFLLVIKDQGIT